MRILFHPSTPVPIRTFLCRHSVSTAFQHSWSTLRNGEMLAAAEAAGFDVVLTADWHMRYQQNRGSKDRRPEEAALGALQAFSAGPWGAPSTPRSRSPGSAPGST